MKQQIYSALRIYLFMSLLLGIAYPLLVTGFAQVLFPGQANGNLIEQNGKIVGADLIGQKFTKPEYFWSRPSANDYNPLSSGGSNLGPTSKVLKKMIEERKNNLLQQNSGTEQNIKKNLLYASASGLDPHISPQAAEYQIARVAKARGLSEDKVKDLMVRYVEKPQLGFLGEPTVNVLRLNLALDQK